MNKSYICFFFCLIRFELKSTLSRHIHQVHDSVNIQICEICAKPFKSIRSYENHYRVAHTEQDQRVQCEICGRWLKHINSLKEHKRLHTISAEQCQFCGKMSSNKKYLKAHIRAVHHDPTFKCSVCEKSFRVERVLKVLVVYFHRQIIIKPH